MTHSNKLKISPDFIWVKLMTIGLLPFILLILSDYKRMDFDTVMNYIIILTILIILSLWLFTRPKIYYDEATFYINQGKAKTEVFLSNIQSIEFSLIGFGISPFSYKISYLTVGGNIESKRLFRSLFGDLSKFFDLVEKENPNVKITRSLFG